MKLPSPALCRDPQFLAPVTPTPPEPSPRPGPEHVCLCVCTHSDGSLQLCVVWQECNAYPLGDRCGEGGREEGTAQHSSQNHVHQRTPGLLLTAGVILTMTLPTYQARSSCRSLAAKCVPYSHYSTPSPSVLVGATVTMVWCLIRPQGLKLGEGKT